MDEALHENSGYRPVRAWVLLSMHTCLAAIFVGLLIPSSPTNAKMFILFAMVYFAVLSKFLMPFFYPDDEPNAKYELNRYVYKRNQAGLWPAEVE